MSINGSKSDFLRIDRAIKHSSGALATREMHLTSFLSFGVWILRFILNNRARRDTRNWNRLPLTGKQSCAHVGSGMTSNKGPQQQQHKGGQGSKTYGEQNKKKNMNWNKRKVRFGFVQVTMFWKSFIITRGGESTRIKYVPRDDAFMNWIISLTFSGNLGCFAERCGTLPHIILAEEVGRTPAALS